MRGIIFCMYFLSLLFMSEPYGKLIKPFNKDTSAFKKYVIKYEKVLKTGKEWDNSYSQFQKNIDFINEHNNNPKKGFSLKVNQFADEDIKSLKRNLFSCRIQRPSKSDEDKLNDVNVNRYGLTNLVEPLPDLDYRELNAVTPVKNQRQCGSCWAFSAVGALEGKNAIATGELKRFSEQRMVDCSKSNHGCEGGLMHLAYDDLMWGDYGLPLEEDYPYLGIKRNCNSTLKGDVGASLLGYNFVLSHSSDALKRALQYSPVAIALAGDPMEFLFYGEGIFDERETSKENTHAVLLVGYNTTNEVPYWIIKNSWSKKWGEDGYIRVKMEDGEGILGMNQYGLYPY